MTVEFKAKGNRGEIWLYDQIGASFWGDGITAATFQKELAALGKVSVINLRINSPGGDVFDGFAIYNQLKQHPARVEVDVDGVAASIASIIAMSGDEIRMAKNAMMMIHNPQGGTYGDESELRRVAALLDTIKNNLTATYVDRTGSKAAEVDAWMDDETWFTAEAAVERGFADKVTSESQVHACFDPRWFRNVPAGLKARMSASAGTPTLDLRRQRIADQAKALARMG